MGLTGRIEQWLDREHGQLALWIPVGLGSGIAAWFLIATREGWIAFAFLAFAGAAAFAALWPGGRLGRAGAWFLLLAGLGCLLIWWRAGWVAAPRLERPVVRSFDAGIEDVELLSARGLVRLTLATDPGQSLPPRVRVNVGEDHVLARYESGDHVRLRARLLPPAAAALPGAYDFARTAWFRGIGATGRALDPVAVLDRARQTGFHQWIARLRTRLSAHIQRAVGGSAGGIATAFVTGDQGAIAEQDVQAMRTAGLAHLLSISGLHVGAVVGGAMFLALRLLALSPSLALRAPLPLIAAGVAALAGVAYTLIAGAEVPTVRSCIAAILVIVALAIGREAITLRLVAAGALVVLLFRPEALTGPSFQLSFAAVTALVAFHELPSVRRFGRRREHDGWLLSGLRKAALLLATGLVIEAVLAPIALYHFHRAGIYGSIANIIAIPLTTFIVIPSEFLALLLDLAGLGYPLWWITEISLKTLINMSLYIQSWPGSTASLPTMPGAPFAIMLGSGLWFCLWRTNARLAALPPFLCGIFWAVATPGPDILISGDGYHVAVRASEGGLSLLRPRAGDYVRDMFASVSADDALGAMDAAASARCNADLCEADLVKPGRLWRLLATRSPYHVPWRDMVGACRMVDIVVSDRRLPRACVPRWLKADRDLLGRTGGLAIRLDPLSVSMVRRTPDDHPWMISPASYRR